MQKSSKIVVSQILNRLRPRVILDAPCGDGWLPQSLSYEATMDGVDLYATPSCGAYRAVFATDLNQGIPSDAGMYDAIVCCEGIEHLGNPLLLIESAKAHLSEGGILLVTTPNIWYPASKLQFFLRGFFPGFPCLIGRIKAGTHMHITPWSYPHLYLYLRLAGFTNIELHEEPLSHPKRRIDRLLGWPQRLYCFSKFKKAETMEKKTFWETAASDRSSLGRHLIVTAKLNIVSSDGKEQLLRMCSRT